MADYWRCGSIPGSDEVLSKARYPASGSELVFDERSTWRSDVNSASGSELVCDEGQLGGQRSTQPVVGS